MRCNSRLKQLHLMLDFHIPTKQGTAGRITATTIDVLLRKVKILSHAIGSEKTISRSALENGLVDKMVKCVQEMLKIFYQKF